MHDKVKDTEESGAGFLFLTFWQTSRIIFLILLNLGLGVVAGITLYAKFFIYF